jgi:hypothetical protein
MRCACRPGPDGARGGTVVDHVRLFPIRMAVRWTYRVHEQILPSLNRAKVPARWTDVVIRHDGYADPDIEARKLERNIKILERELIERRDDPFVLFNLGASAVQQKDYQAALGLLDRKRCWPNALAIVRRWRNWRGRCKKSRVPAEDDQGRHPIHDANRMISSSSHVSLMSIKRYDDKAVFVDGVAVRALRELPGRSSLWKNVRDRNDRRC